MIEDSPETPQIDYSKLSFPSDRLTIGTLRKHYPQDVDILGKRGFNDPRSGLGDDLANILHIERSVAEEAFNKTLGIRTLDGFESKEDRQSCIDQISGLYTKLGIASGPHHAEQLFRDIETQGENQARELGGRRP